MGKIAREICTLFGLLTVKTSQTWELSSETF
jgi:hypothetical protein